MRTNKEYSSKTRRTLHLWLPYLSVERYRREAGWGNEERAVVLARDEQARRVVAAACPLASTAGIAVGRSVTDALALDPSLMVATADPAADHKALEALADWCGRYTPQVAIDPSGRDIGDGGLWLDITGCAHLFGGESALLDDLLIRLAGFGWTGQAALADTPGAAWAVARFGDRAVRVVEPGAQRAAIARLPLAALRLPPAVVEGLDRVGLRQVETLISVARSPLTARFGSSVALRLDQALGLAPELISPQVPTFPHRVRLSLPEPIVTTEDVGLATQRLLARLIERLEREHRGARRLRLSFYRVDGTVRQLTIGTSRPSRDAAALYRLLAEHFDKLDPGFGIDVVTLEALELDAAAPTQTGLNAGDRDAASTAIGDLTDRLANRLGARAVTRPVAHASHVPERAEAFMPIVQAFGERWPRDFSGPGGSSSVISGPTRPPRLLRRPERVEAMALLPDHPPVRFHWRGAEVWVGRAIGPERLAPEWWRDQARQATRDYFRIEDVEGRRYWLYREGLAECGEAPVWYLHGLFA
ncbi:MAG: DNA polymerase Y family protein [Alphaproteobacteria bacterium]|nr:DNA polymerase Y family protein [Alphaproteobacteria bacterium]